MQLSLAFLIILRPHLPQHLHTLQLPRDCWRLALRQDLEQQLAIAPNLLRQAPALLLFLGQAPIVHAPLIALQPLIRHPGEQPVGGHLGQVFQHRPQRLAHRFQVMQAAHRCQHMRGIRAHLASGLQPAALAAHHEQLVEQTLLRSLRQQPLPKFGEHGLIKARVT